MPRGTPRPGQIGQRGAWVADLELDLDTGQAEPSGGMTLTVPTGQALTGYGVAGASGRIGTRRSVRLVGGTNGGWSRLVPPRHHHNDGGVKLSHVMATLAAEVGERVSILGFLTHFNDGLCVGRLFGQDKLRAVDLRGGGFCRGSGWRARLTAAYQ